MAKTQFGGFGFNDILKEEITKLIRTDQPFFLNTIIDWPS